MELILQITGFGLFLLIYSFILSHVLPERHYSWVNLLVSIGSVAYAVWIVGLSLNDLGLSPHSLGLSLIIGCLGGLIVITAVAGLSHIPSLRPNFIDKVRLKPRTNEMLNELAWRIPFGTALSEEVMFRGVLLGLLLTKPTVLAVSASALIFGLWHIAPTIRNFHKSPSLQRLVDNDLKFKGHVFMTVLATTIVGVVFALLRIWTHSLLAVWMIHSAINGASIAAGYIWLKPVKRK